MVRVSFSSDTKDNGRKPLTKSAKSAKSATPPKSPSRSRRSRIGISSSSASSSSISSSSSSSSSSLSSSSLTTFTHEAQNTPSPSLPSLPTNPQSTPPPLPPPSPTTPSPSFSICIDTRTFTPDPVSTHISSQSNLFLTTMGSFVDCAKTRGLFTTACKQQSYLLQGLSCTPSPLPRPQSPSQSSSISPKTEIPSITVPQSSVPYEGSYSYMTSFITKVSKIILEEEKKKSGRKVKCVKGVSGSGNGGSILFKNSKSGSATSESPAVSATAAGGGGGVGMNILIYFPDHNVFADSFTNEATSTIGTPSPQLKKFITTCLKTLTSPSIQTITLVILRCGSPSSLSYTLPLHDIKQTIQNCNTNSNSSKLTIEVTDCNSLSLHTHLQQLISKHLVPSLTTEFELPKTENGDACKLKLRLCPTLLPTPAVGGSAGAGVGVGVYLQQESLSELEVTRLVCTTEINVAMIYGIPLLATVDDDANGNNGQETKALKLTLNSLCTYLTKNNVSLLLSSKSFNPVTSTRDFYYFIPGVGGREGLLLQCATGLQIMSSTTSTTSQLQSQSSPHLTNDEFEISFYNEYIQEAFHSFGYTKKVNPFMLDGVGDVKVSSWGGDFGDDTATATATDTDTDTDTRSGADSGGGGGGGGGRTNGLVNIDADDEFKNDNDDEDEDDNDKEIDESIRRALFGTPQDPQDGAKEAAGEGEGEAVVVNEDSSPSDDGAYENDEGDENDFIY